MNEKALTQSVGDARWVLCDDNVWRDYGPEKPAPVVVEGPPPKSKKKGHCRYRHLARNFYPPDGRCAYCRRVMSHAYATVDHIIPKSRGGSPGLDNIAWACMRCNGEKGDRTPAEMGWETPEPVCDTKLGPRRHTRVSYH